MPRAGRVTTAGPGGPKPFSRYLPAPSQHGEPGKQHGAPGTQQPASQHGLSGQQAPSGQQLAPQHGLSGQHAAFSVQQSAFACWQQAAASQQGEPGKQHGASGVQQLPVAQHSPPGQHDAGDPSVHMPAVPATDAANNANANRVWCMTYSSDPLVQRNRGSDTSRMMTARWRSMTDLAGIFLSTEPQTLEDVKRTR